MLGKELLLRKLESNDPETIVARFDTYSMSSDDMRRLSEAIKTNEHVEELDLLDCGINANDIPLLLDAIKCNNFIRAISIEQFQNDTSNIKETIKEIHECVERNNSAHWKNTVLK